MMQRITSFTTTAMLISLLCGCATTTGPNAMPEDPYEPWNRKVWKVNRVLDKAIAQPVAYMYHKYLPGPFQHGIGNFFDNFREVTNIANDLLQLELNYFWYDTCRLVVNTSVGLFGIFDPASALGLERRQQDFGQTLYHWGYKESAYFVLPILGPSTIRDSIGVGVDYFGLSAWAWIHSDWRKYALLALDGIDLRARFLGNEAVIDAVALDEYAFIRDAYLQRRKYLFTNENSEVVLDEDPFDEEFGS